MTQLELPHTQTEFHYQTVELFKTEILGVGSYGAVCKAKCDELPCAAKILHLVMFQSNDPGAMAFLRKFEQECQFLRTIKHPNIVQYIATYQDHETGLPVLLMELMDESLTSFLERSQQPLPYHTQVDLCHDIVLAVAYLHFNRMVHRDLSSNNVLLIAGSRAKVTDFGLSKLIDTNPRMTPLTKCPGTLVYMPPEALRDLPMYSEKLDCFSEGVLTIQIITRKFPNPSPASRMVEDPRYPLGRVQVLVPEAERRRSHIDLIDPTHPLLPPALRCLEYNEEDRPSAQELCRCLAAFKEAPMYTQSVQQAWERGTHADTEGTEAGQISELERQLQTNTWQIQTLQQQLQEKDQQLETNTRQIQTLQQQVQEKDHQLETNTQQIQTLQQQLQAKDATIAQMERENQQQLQEKNQELQQITQEKDQEIQARERQLRELDQQLQTNKQATVEFQQNLLQKEREVRDLEERLSEKEELVQHLQQLRISDDSRTKQEASGGVGKIPEMKWRISEICVSYMQPAVKDKTAYFISSWRNVWAYDSEIEKWSELPRCPHEFFALAVVNGLLTAVGGIDRSDNPTNKLLSLTREGRERKWEECFLPMPTKRWLATVLGTGKYLIVAGGLDTPDWPRLTNKVEVMKDTRQWITASGLPHPLYQVTATLCGDDVYMLGGFDKHKKASKSVFRCSLNALLQPSQGTLTKLAKALKGASVWQQVTDLPVTESACATLQGCLLAVGGKDSSGKLTTAIHEYNPVTNSWQVVSHMLAPIDGCAVAVLPGDGVVAANHNRMQIGTLQ